MLTWETVKVML